MFYHYDISGALIGTYPVSTFPGEETEVDPPQLRENWRRRWDGTQWIEVPDQFVVQRRTAAAWEAANAFAEAQMDLNSRHSIDMFLAVLACPAARRSLIVQYSQWWTAVWMHYATIKAQIQTGVDAHFDPSVPGPCPVTIWQIAAPPESV